MATIINTGTSKLYMRDSYTSKDVEYVIARHITEYDMKEAGWNLIINYNLLSAEQIEMLGRLTKDKRKIEIGNLQKNIKGFAHSLTESFMLMRKEFFMANELVDNDIISVKKDAIFILDKRCIERKFGNIEFRDKNSYSSYHRFNNTEMYYNSSTDTLDVKGINDENVKLHDDYMVSVLKHVFLLLEEGSKTELVKFIKTFVNLYKSRKLEVGYYRELNPPSCYTFNKEVNSSNYNVYGFSNIDQKDIDILNISYNYMNFVLPLLQRYYYDKI